MRTIGVLDFVRKKKRMILPCLLALGTLAFFPGYGCSAEGDGVIMRTPSPTSEASGSGASNSGAVIGTDPETGARVMRTPPPRERESFQGPQTIIVSPEVFPNGSGNRPPSRPPQNSGRPSPGAGSGPR